MRTLVFIDLEVNPETKKVLDFGAVDANGETLHTTQKTVIFTIYCRLFLRVRPWCRL